jgi:hypothetical protein
MDLWLAVSATTLGVFEVDGFGLLSLSQLCCGSAAL